MLELKAVLLLIVFAPILVDRKPTLAARSTSTCRNTRKKVGSYWTHESDKYNEKEEGSSDLLGQGYM